MQLRARLEHGGTPLASKWGILVLASSKNLIAACRSEDLTVYVPDVSMIGNGGGAVHCMCQALRRDSVAR